MLLMFTGASAFNHDIGNWDTTGKLHMRYMFHYASSRSTKTLGWDTQLVTTMSFMFIPFCAFNQDNESWNTEKVTTMGMFIPLLRSTKALGLEHGAMVTSMESMFHSTSSSALGLETHRK